MFDIHLIQQMVDWERRLEIEKERQKNLRGEPYSNSSTVPQPDRKEQPSFFKRIFKLGRGQQTADPCYPRENCKDSLPG